MCVMQDRIPDTPVHAPSEIHRDASGAIDIGYYRELGKKLRAEAVRSSLRSLWLRLVNLGHAPCE